MSGPLLAQQVVPPLAANSAAPPELDQAITKFNQHKYEESLQLLRQAAERNAELQSPRTMLAGFFLQADQLAEARAMLELAVVEQQDDPEAYRMLGELAFRERRVTEAELLFQELQRTGREFKGNAIRKRNYGIAARAGLAAVAESRQQYEVAREHLAAWIAEAPRNAGAHARLGEVLFHLRQLDQAYAELQAAAEISPEVYLPEVTMGRLFQQTSEPQQAKLWMERAVTNNPRSIPTRLAVAQWQWENGELEVARGHIDQALQTNPESLEAQILAGLIARFQNRLDDAEQYFQAVFLQSPSNAVAANQLALVLAQQGGDTKRRRALELAENNLRQFTNNQDVAATLGWLYTLAGRNEEATRIFQAIAQSGTVSSDIAYFMALLASRTGNPAAATKTLRSALETQGPFAFRDDAEQLYQQLSQTAPTP
jgi:tetratricopeptide (TPR) repeat protein